MVDRVNAPVNQNQPSDDEQKTHEEKMIEVADADATRITSVDSQNPEGDRDLTQTPAEGDDTDVAKRPDDIPEKFWDAEKGEVNVAALLKAQQDGEAALRKAQGKPDDSSDDNSNDDAGDNANTDDSADDTSDNQSNVVADASAEFAKDGKLSDDTYEKLAKVGLSKDYVDSYIAGQQALVSQMETAIYGPFDGKDGYEKAADWAASNLTEEEIQALDVQIQSPNPAIAAEGAKALAARYAADADVDPEVNLRGGNNSGVTGQYYKSSAEMQKDMSDPRYAKDPAFRAEVQAKIDRADKAGVSLFG